MDVESFAARVTDDGSPPAALDIAGQAVRDFNHRSFGVWAAGAAGWEGPPDCYRALGELSYLAGGLPQAFEQIARALRGALAAGRMVMDVGSAWEGNEQGAVAEATAALEAAAAQVMYRGIAEAHSVITRAGTAAGTGGPAG